ncbi:MAG: hypothetical protein AB7S69_16350 [Salinivirgaceae bacterium]
MKTNPTIVKILVSIALIAGIAGLILSLTPLKMIALIPSVLGIVFGIAAYAIAKSKKGKLGFIYVVLIIATIGMVTSLVREFGMEDKVAVDEQFQETTEQAATETEEGDDLEDALDELEELE